MYITYDDKNLEAKIFPELFPYGNGSWNRECGISIGNYIKQRLLFIDNRFRNSYNWSYFMFDRVIKQRLFYFSHTLKTNIQDREDVLTFRELRTNQENMEYFLQKNKDNKDIPLNCYARYGTIVPNTIPGCKSYWTSRLLDLMAMSKELGLPTLFVTLTQYDGWPELQRNNNKGIGLKSSPIEIESLISHIYSLSKHCTNNSVETCIAFNKRFEQF